jgi:hypothetical protein
MVQAGMTHQVVADHVNVSRIIISRLMIRLRQTGTQRPGESFQPEPYPPLAHGHSKEPWHRRSCEHSNFQNGKLFIFFDTTINDRRWFKCLIRSLQTRSWDGKFTFRNFPIMQQDVIVKINNLPFWKLECSQERRCHCSLEWPWASGGYGSGWNDSPGRCRPLLRV